MLISVHTCLAIPGERSPARQAAHISARAVPGEKNLSNYCSLGGLDELEIPTTLEVRGWWSFPVEPSTVQNPGSLHLETEEPNSNAEG